MIVLFCFLCARNESELIVEIVNDIIKKLDPKHSKKSKNSKLLHGVYQNLVGVASSIKVEPHFHVNGLLGKGGNGKKIKSLLLDIAFLLSIWNVFPLKMW